MYRIFLCCLLITLASTCFGQFSYAPVDVPGAAATVARGINNVGEVVGFYQTTSCSNYDLNVPDCATEGFTLINSKYATVTVPNSTATVVNGVNDLGDLVGFYTKSDGTRHGFIWLHTNVIKTIDASGTSYSTVPMGISKAGTVVGGLWSISTSGTFSEGGWAWLNGKFTTMNPLGSTNGTCCQSVNGISNNSITMGQVFYRDFWTSWFMGIKDLDFWKYNTGDTFGTAVDTSADVAGYSTANSGWFAQHIESGEIGDREPTLSFKVVSYPGSQSTQVFGMNDSRYLAGSYFDSTGTRHGFIAQPQF